MQRNNPEKKTDDNAVKSSKEELPFTNLFRKQIPISYLPQTDNQNVIDDMEDSSDEEYPLEWRLGR